MKTSGCGTQRKVTDLNPADRKRLTKPFKDYLPMIHFEDTCSTACLLLEHELLAGTFCPLHINGLFAGSSLR